MSSVQVVHDTIMVILIGSFTLGGVALAHFIHKDQRPPKL